MKRNLIATLVAAVVVAGFAANAQAADIVDEWASIKAPPPPALKPVTVDPKTTALLMLDFMNQNCGKRPRCIATLPAMKRLLGEARAHKVLVIYSITANTTAADVMGDVAPLAAEPHVQSGPNKFRNTELEKILKNKGIATVIVTGTAANGAVLSTAMGATLRGFTVIAPVDGLSSVQAYADLSTVYTFTTARALVGKSTLTRSGMIKF
jgi:nicotinamidase-related amidase